MATNWRVAEWRSRVEVKAAGLVCGARQAIAREKKALEPGPLDGSEYRKREGLIIPVRGRETGAGVDLEGAIHVIRRGELGCVESGGRETNGRIGVNEAGAMKGRPRKMLSKQKHDCSGRRVGRGKRGQGNGHYRTHASGEAIGRNCSVFACALVFSPVRMAGQTACPEESLARARKHCNVGKGEADGNGNRGGRMSDLRFEISDFGFESCGGRGI